MNIYINIYIENVVIKLAITTLLCTYLRSLPLFEGAGGSPSMGALSPMNSAMDIFVPLFLDPIFFSFFGSI